ncbi:hypothetical protein [Methanobrevibacter filiformis]|uniref:Uncharacterized protein n=1 Tax=Methanobrevibacter filiformis TaxID=55758 RepID=A0A165ZT02_9EURY|nr:hypothetical protein [Methanobrevibacter filiformis]KZX11123.1 hypothetical protein MBFIL_15200 [Methanobrevibacter filiformis]
MNNKLLILLIISAVALLTVPTATFADNGTYTGSKVVLTENGERVTYDEVCVEHNNLIYAGQSVKTMNDIQVKNGTIEYIVENWGKIGNSALQNGVWNLSEGNNPVVHYPDFYKVNSSARVVNTTTQIMVDGVLRNGTLTTSYLTEFTFRMVGDGYLPSRNSSTYQDLLIFKTESLNTSFFTPDEITAPEEEELPEVPVNETPVEPPKEEKAPEVTIDETPDETPEVSITPEQPDEVEEPVKDVPKVKAAMKKTGMPLIMIIIVLLSSLGLTIYRKNV